MEEREKSVRIRIRQKEPNKLSVYMINDDVTTMDFVIMILMEVFFYDYAKAEETMFKVDREGEAYIGTYEAAIAKSKVASVEKRARAAGFPLKCRLEPEKV